MQDDRGIERRTGPWRRGGAPMARGANRRSRPRVAVIADRFLVGDAVRTALNGRGFEAMSRRTPRRPEEIRECDVALNRFQPAIGLVLTEVDDPVLRRDAAALVTRIRTRWLLLTGSESLAARGAVVASGAVGVLPMSVSLEELARVLAEVLAGRAVMSEGQRLAAIRAWQELYREQRRLVVQMEGLTRRELAVLGLLYDGASVRAIAEQAGVSEGTVRSQVKSILRKLQVNSQLAAVAAYRHVTEQGLEPRNGG